VTETNTSPMALNVPRYAGIYVIALLALGVIAVIVRTVLGLDISGAVSIIPPVIAASMMEGQRMARIHKRVMTNREAWRAAVLATVAYLGVNFMLMAVAMMVPAIGAMIAQAPAGIMLGVAAVIALIVLLSNRWFIAMGVKSEIKRQEAL
jgi:small-conductance mechanosensitive channel